MTDFRKIRGLRERLNEFPPFMVFNLARVPVRYKRYRRMTEEEICRESRLSSYMVAFMVRSTSWDNIHVGDMLAFMAACGFDIMRLRGAVNLLRINVARHRAFCHLSDRQMIEFSKKVQEWKKSCQSEQS